MRISLIKQKLFVLLLALALVTGLISGCASKSQPVPTSGDNKTDVKQKAGEIVWVNQDAYYGAYSGNIAPLFIKWVDELTDGRLKIKYNAPSSIVPTAELFTAVSEGTIDFAGTNYGGFYRGIFPLADLEEIPIIFSDPMTRHDFIWNTEYYEIMSKEFEKRNIKWFPVGCDFLAYNLALTTEITSLDDIRGKKIRVGAGIFQDYVKKLGGVPTIVPMPETYFALQTGALDGVFTAFGANEESHLQEVLKSWVIDPNPTMCNASFLINLDKWNALPDDIQKLIEQNFKYWNYEAMVNDYIYDKKIEAKAKKENKFVLHTLSPEDRKKSQQIWLDLMKEYKTKGPVYEKVINMAFDYMEQVGLLE